VIKVVCSTSNAKIKRRVQTLILIMLTNTYIRKQKWKRVFPCDKWITFSNNLTVRTHVRASINDVPIAERVNNVLDETKTAPYEGEYLIALMH
jgi:hypothetical protein